MLDRDECQDDQQQQVEPETEGDARTGGLCVFLEKLDERITLGGLIVVAVDRLFDVRG